MHKDANPVRPNQASCGKFVDRKLNLILFYVDDVLVLADDL